MKPHMLVRLTLLGGLLGGLAACGPDDPGPMVGGPCSYDKSVVEGTVIAVDEDGAQFIGEEGEFWVSDSYLGRIPAIGEKIRFQLERITEGTCTPEIYTVIDGSGG
nr:hypothetical protein [uncultured Hyphomonas sp.]